MIDLNDIPKFPKPEPDEKWCCTPVWCCHCGHHWIEVHPISTYPNECTKCGKNPNVGLLDENLELR